MKRPGCRVLQEQRQVGMVRNPGVRLKCDQQSARAWLRSGERASGSTADFCDTGGAAELAVKALFPHMQRWARNLQAITRHTMFKPSV